MMISHRLQDRRGFTLTELLVSIAVILLLIGLLVPALSSAKAASRTMSCAGQSRQVGMAFQMYASDYQSKLPFSNGSAFPGNLPEWPDLMDEYLKAGGDRGAIVTGAISTHRDWVSVAICPETRGLMHFPTRGSYGGNGWVLRIRNNISIQNFRLEHSTVPGNTLLTFDGTIGRNNNLGRVHLAMTPPATLNTLIATNQDRDAVSNADRPTAAQPRYRHHANTANGLFLDGHVDPLTKGKVTTNQFLPNM